MAGHASDDPFAVFGDDDEDDQIARNTMASWAGRQLVEQANERIAQKSLSRDGACVMSKVGSKQTQEDSPVDVSALDDIDLWPDDPPLYLNPSVRLVSSLPVGGGRGLVATKDLLPGTLVLVEKPMMTWPDAQLEEVVGLITVQLMFQLPSAQTFVHDIEDFHPSKEHVESGTGHFEQVRSMMQHLRVQHEGDSSIEELLKVAQEIGITSRDGTRLSMNDIFRIMLALRYNGLQSGVYRHVAMLNHSCHPNCVKLMPTKGYSEVRITRPVRAGDSLTIFYPTRILSHSSRRKLLWDQHRFDIGIDLGEWRPMELIGAKLPLSALDRWDENAVTVRIETATAQLEDHYQEAAHVIKGAPSGDPAWDELKALEVTSHELCMESANQLLNDRHVLLIPCLRLHLDVCDLVEQDSSLTSSQRVLFLCRLVESAVRLRDLQIAHHGPDHFDLAQTNLELAQALEELLSRAPKQLQKLRLPGMGNFAECASTENASRAEYHRIRALYPHDADDFIINNTNKQQD